jgi:hypothetical protein
VENTSTAGELQEGKRVLHPAVCCRRNNFLQGGFTVLARASARFLFWPPSSVPTRHDSDTL